MKFTDSQKKSEMTNMRRQVRNLKKNRSLFSAPVHVSVCCACAKNVLGHLALVWCCLAVALWCAGGVLLGRSAGAVV